MAFVRNFLQEFKKFAMRGNAIDLAVGVVLGAAFTKIVNSIVLNVFTPITSYMMGSADFSNKVVPLPSVLGRQAEIGVGAVAQSIVEFIIVAFVMFLVVRAMNRLNLQLGAPPVPEDVRLLREIRDLLASNAGKASG
jgi:large conductance mechanosensitive channel